MGESGSDKLTAEQAVALLREHAFVEDAPGEPGDDRARGVVEAVVLCGDELASAGFRVLVAHAVEVWTALNMPGRSIIHSRVGGMGADLDLDHAIELTERAVEIGWIESWFGHNLGVLVDGTLYAFDVPRPADG